MADFDYDNLHYDNIGAGYGIEIEEKDGFGKHNI